jgi:L,D-transpeptidase-like protein
MVKKIVCMCAYLIVSFSFKTVSADGTKTPLSVEQGIENQISNLYKQIDFSKTGRLSYEVFNKACYGYLNLRNEGKVDREKEIISVCDFSMPSTEKRLWIIDLAKKKVVFNTYVAHGQGSGEDGDLSFSNKNSTHKSSLGFYVTGDTYEGEHGTSLHLVGMDQGFNDAAFDRGIVVHGAKYVCDRYINQNDRLGRSWGCPAVPAALSLPIINTIKDRTCLFIYYPEAKYLKTAYWLNKKIDCLPQNIL